MLESIISIIVTYGTKKRLPNLVKELRSLDKINEIKKIIIVANGANYNIEDEILQLQLSIEIEYVINLENKGSSGGFKDGINAALLDENLRYDYILLLDDDVTIDADSISAIQDVESRGFDGVDSDHIWSLYRPNKYPNTFLRNWDYNLHYYQNLFGSVSVERKIFMKKMRNLRKNKNIACLTTSTYAGLLLPTQAVKNYKLFPDQNYYLYVDDLDFSVQMIMNDIKIYQIQKAWLQDEDVSFGSSRKFGAVKDYFQSNESGFRYLYTMRNFSYFIKKNNLVTNRFIFKINKIIYYASIFILFMPKTVSGLKKFSILRQAINKGLNKEMGADSNFFERNRN